MRLKALSLILLGFMLALPTAGAMAQGESGGLDKRLELARAMHEIRPMSVQIEAAVQALSLRYPEDKRERFVAKMLETFDQKTLTEISIRAMAETFTVAELEKMIDFYGSPEGRAASEKMPVYQAIVEPEIVKKLDAALMEIRTGAPAASP